MTDMESRVAREDTKYGDHLEDHDWSEDDDFQEEPASEAVEVSRHTLVINDERDAIDRYNGLKWMFLIDEGIVTAIDKSHYCPGPGHTDPMGFEGWSDVPSLVQKRVLEEMNASRAEDVVDIDRTEEVAEDQWP